MNNDIADLLLKNFPDINIVDNKILSNSQYYKILEFLKHCPELSFDMLLSIIAVDYIEFIELNYLLFATILNEDLTIKVRITDNTAESVIKIYSSAYFDECEIYDLFGINFIGNTKLKRLFLPDSWQGYPLRKNYVMNDERLIWNG